MLRFLLTALCLPMLAACSKTVSVTPTPPPPANLAQACQMLLAPPLVLVDPDRLQWEADILAAYADCAIRHRLTVEAWQEAVKASEK